MLRIGLPALVASWLLTGLLTAADLDQVDRTIRKEPAYQTKSPRYGLLVFGPDATDRVWLVLDGDALYVDRNGNGDLTEPGEKIAAKVDKSRDTAEVGYTFEVGDLAVGGKIHKGLIVGFAPLARYATNPTIAAFPPFQDALKADPKAHMAYVTLDVESARLKGGSVGNRLAYIAGPNDATGYLIFARQQARAPLVHFDGPLCITFYGRAPTLRLARDNDLILMVGTPGRGPGTFAMLCYQDTMPEKAYPKVEVIYPPGESKGMLVKEVYELKQRC